MYLTIGLISMDFSGCILAKKEDGNITLDHGESLSFALMASLL